jgi:uncharacterized protein
MSESTTHLVAPVSESSRIVALDVLRGFALICLILFTGAGFALVGHLDRWMLYPIVGCIWVVQLFYSDWWLRAYRFGPIEWLWRAVTYGEFPAMKR